MNEFGKLGEPLAPAAVDSKSLTKWFFLVTEATATMAHPISEGARLTYLNVCLEGDPQVASPIGMQPQIHRADCLFPRAPVVGSRSVTPNEVYLKRLHGATRAYALTNDKVVSLPRGRGLLLYAVVYEWNGYAFAAPDPARSPPQHVVIKQLSKKAIRENFVRGGIEDPLKEIALLKSLGDDNHVIRLIDALEDNDYLYIITRRGVALDKVIRWNSPCTLPLERVRFIYLQLLRILQYLERHNICHRDISPSNLVFLAPNRMVLIDFGFALRIPVNLKTRRRVRMVGQGSFGTMPFMCPELFRNDNYDGVLSDHWSASMILFSLLTNKLLYAYPFPVDAVYRHFILNQGLSVNPSSECDETVTEAPICRGAASTHACHHFHSLNVAIKRLGDGTRRFLGNLLHPDPALRLTLAQAIESDFLQPRYNLVSKRKLSDE